ncbi:MAG TPA: glycosyl hydrolase family 18 protein, partial [Thermoplasmata archaeon]|nr:glycosyl hydrolase family 18 protein [Thermoplasmata archaeon]
WPPTQMITDAHAAGVKVVLTMTSFTDATTDAVLADPAKVATHVDALLNLVQTAGADGVNIDIEGVPKTNSVSGLLNRGHLIDYFKALAQKFWAADPAYQISLDLPAVDWSDVWNVSAIAPHVTYEMIMAYDYYWRGSANAGSVAPLDNGGGISVRRSVDYYLDQGLPKEKLLAGFPYYGYEWATASDQRGAATSGQGTAKTYNVAVAAAQQHGRKWDTEWKTPWYAYQSGAQWYQGHYDDAESLGLKYDLALQRDVAGIGIWALGYDAGKNELWDKIREKFADSAAPLVSFVSPGNNSNLSGVANVSLNASDDHVLASVALHLDGSKLVDWTAPPFDFAWDTTSAANGVHQLKATAVDWKGNSAESTIGVEVWNSPPPPPPPNDTTPPKLSIAAPADGAEVKGDVAIVVDASDETKLDKVRLSIDGIQAAEWNSAPFRHVWASKGVGNHKLTAEAWDAAGNRAAFEITIIVTDISGSKPPQVVATVPSAGATAGVGTQITLLFSEPMEHATVESSWNIAPATSGTFKWDSNSLVFTPSAPLSADTSYKLQIGTTAKSSAGVAMNSTFVLEFRTEKSGSGHGGGGVLGSSGILSPVPLVIGLAIGVLVGATLAFTFARRKGKTARSATPDPASAEDLFGGRPPT